MTTQTKIMWIGAGLGFIGLAFTFYDLWAKLTS
jgi:hypothetical protein